MPLCTAPGGLLWCFLRLCGGRRWRNLEFSKKCWSRHSGDGTPAGLVFYDLGGGNSNIFLFSSRNLGKWSNLTDIFQMGWNHQSVIYEYFFLGGTAQHKWAANKALVIRCSTGDGTTQLYSGTIFISHKHGLCILWTNQGCLMVHVMSGLKFVGG